MTYPMLMPIYTAEILHDKADTLGFLMGAAGIGALFASLFLAAKTSLTGLRRILFAGAVIFSIGFITIGLCHTKINRNTCNVYGWSWYDIIHHT